MTEPFVVTVDAAVTADELLALMAACGNSGWGAGTADVWNRCLRESLGVVSVRDEQGTLVGVGFLIGNARHAEIVDLSVRPDVQHRGLGRRIVSALVESARARDIRYLNLVADPGRPWLADWYIEQGFEPIDFALSRPVPH